jgi:hypothetical protein
MIKRGVQLNPVEQCAIQVDQWIERNAQGLSLDQLVALFQEALHRLQERTLLCLSEVTFFAVLDRVLIQSQQQHPLLKRVRVTSKVISFDHSMAGGPVPESKEIIESFRCFLTHLLNVLGSITGGILMSPLCVELERVKFENIKVTPEKSRQNDRQNDYRESKHGVRPVDREEV